MKFPYQCLHVSGDVLFAASGASIHSFNLSDGSHVESWTHPTYTSGPIEAAEVDSPAIESSEPAVGGTPPAKRRKLATEDAAENGTNGEAKAAANEAGEPKKETQRQRRKQKLASQRKPPEIPLVICLEGSSNGSHIVAVTSTDKTIWVFEHDGKGHLKQLRQRAMPKRPSTIAITADGKTIVSGDKFGDVYSLPLIPSDLTTPTTTGTTATPPASKPRGPQANELTVHSQRNLKALEAQRKNLEEKLAKPKLDPDAVPSNEPEVGDHTLLLGHVSLLTSLLLASSPAEGTSKSREYIITADRDEHIRVSRGIPQAYVIESFCLGHESFVNRLCLLPRMDAPGESVLVSGGGDDALFVWDWRAGRLLHKVPLLEHTGEAKLAVSALLGVRCKGSAGEDEMQLFVLCERVPKVIVFRMKSDGNLVHLQNVQLPGIPLDMVAIGSSRLAISIMPSSDEGAASGSSAVSDLLVEMEHRAEGWSLVDGKVGSAIQVVEDCNLSRNEIEKLLFNVETLRKMDADDMAGSVVD